MTSPTSPEQDELLAAVARLRAFTSGHDSDENADNSEPNFHQDVEVLAASALRSPQPQCGVHTVDAIIKAARECVHDYYVASGIVHTAEGDGYGALRALRVALELHDEAALSPDTARGREWQPIETAPRDGTPIEVCNTRHPSRPPVIVRWTDEGLSEDLLDPHWTDAATADGSALYYNQNYFDFWKPTTPLPSADGGSK